MERMRVFSTTDESIMIPSRASHQQFRVWLALSITTGLVILLYLSLSLSVSADPLLMPLDDTYIHFQYARQMAQGQPMVYHDGDPATSGGTSLIYPALLALGYQLGFYGLVAGLLGAGAWRVLLLRIGLAGLPDRAREPVCARAAGSIRPCVGSGAGLRAVRAVHLGGAERHGDGAVCVRRPAGAASAATRIFPPYARWPRR